MRKIISMVLVIAMIFSMAMPAFAAETPQYTFALSMTSNKETVNVEDTVTLTVTAETTLESVESFEYHLMYDTDKFEFVSGEKGESFSATSVDNATAESMVVITGLDTVNADPITVSAGTLCTVTFKAKEAAEAAEFSLVHEAMTVVVGNFEDFVDVAVTVPEAPITVSIATAEEPECEHTYVAGICTLCKEADPDYVAPSVTGILSLSGDAEYLTGAETDEIMAFKDITVPYFDLGLYGLEEYYFVSESYGSDGSGGPGNDLEPGTAEYADGKVTMLHLLIYALEVYYYGVDEADAGKGYLYEEGLIGGEAFTIQGDGGSAYMTQFWGGDCNLNYYVNYEYPLASDGVGSTVDQILLREGDLMTVGHFSNWDFYADPYSIFNYIVASDDNPTEGEEITLKLYYAGADLGATGGTAQNKNYRELDVYYVPAGRITSADVTAWTKLGTTDANGELVVDTADLGAGKYIVAVAGQYGEYYPDAICSTPGGLILTIEECDHDYTDGICGNCGAADPDYVAPSNDYVIYSSETGFQAKYTQSDAMITEVVLKGAKDKVLAVNNSENNEAYGALYPYIFLDGDKVQLGDTFEFGIKTIGDDQVTVESAVVELNKVEKSPWVTIRFVDNESANIGGTLCLLKTFTLEGATMNPGEEKELKLTTNLVDRQKKLVPILEWASSDTSVATVSGGKVTAVAPGTATITATLGNKTATCEVTVESKNLTVWTGELSSKSSDLDLYVTEWYVENGKDFVIAYFNDESQIPYGSMNSVLLVDGEQIKVGSKINLGYTVGGDDADKISSVTGNVATIPSYGYYMDMMRITQTDYYSLTNRFDIYPVNKFELADITMFANEETTLTVSTNVQAYAFDKFKDQIVWTSSDESVLTVEGGKVTAVAPGTATITATLGNKTATCEVTVESKNLTVWTGELSSKSSDLDLYVTEWYVENGKDFVIAYFNDESQIPYGSMNSVLLVDGEQIKVGSKINLGYTVGGDDADKISSVTGNVATIPSYGYYMDMMRITQTDYYSLTNRFDIYPVNKFELADVTMFANEETTLTVSTNVQAYAFDKFKDQIVWTSSDESVLTVEGGKITAKALGTATVTAKLGTQTATCVVTVACDHEYFNGVCTKCEEADDTYVAITEITLDSYSTETVTDETGAAKKVLSLKKGATELMEVTLNEGATQGYSWSTSDESVAAVDQDGVITAVGAGTATITVTAGDVVTFAAENTPVTASVEVTVTDVAEGYTLTMPADMSVTAGETVNIPVTLGSTSGTAYNAFDITVSYPEGLTLTSTEFDGLEVTAGEGTIRIKAYGEAREAGSVPFILTFKANAIGEYPIEVTTAKVDNSTGAMGSDAPEAELIDSVTVVTITGYNVTLPDNFTGETVAAPGEDYSFSVPQDNFDYTVTVTVGGEPVEVTDEDGDGTYTIPGSEVDGEIVITATSAPKTFEVTLGEDMTGEKTATFGTDYSATLTPDENYSYEVKITIGGKDYTGYSVSGNTWTIPGGDITGEIVFIVDKNEDNQGGEGGEGGATQHAITFQGSGAGAAADCETKVSNGSDYILTLDKELGYDYTVTANVKNEDGTAGAAVEVTANEDGTYTIAAVRADLIITIERTMNCQVSVHKYVNLDGKTMFLVLVDGEHEDGKHYAYDGKAMYYSFDYEAYAYLTVEEGEFTNEIAAAKVTIADGNKMTIRSQYDVNRTNLVDINDAQLVYDIYNGKYDEVADLGMVKFLYADVNVSMNVTVEDAAAVVANIK